MTDKTVRYMAGSRIDAQCGQCGQSALVTVMDDDTRLCESCQNPYVPPEITPGMLLKWAGYVPPAPKGFATEHVLTADGWTERTVPAEPAPKLCKRCASILLDGKHCPVNPRHNRKPKVTARRDTLAGFQPDTETVIRQSIAPKVLPAHSPVVSAGRTVVTPSDARRKGRDAVEFAPPARSGKVRHFTPLPGPVYQPVAPTTAQSAANRAAGKLAGSVIKRDRKSANVARFAGKRWNGNAACTTCHSAVSESGECLNVAWHMTVLDS